MEMEVRISRFVAEAIRRKCDEAGDREACGLLFGMGDDIDDWRAAPNTAVDPTRHFEIDPGALFAALRAERAGGPRILGYWHSHPSGDAAPSAADVAMAAADGKLWLIVARAQITAWRARQGGFEPVTLVLTP